jgi:dipeptidyl aminopeptidase/acylaminoacyl peptidase
MTGTNRKGCTMETTTRQYGMWPSPITPKSLADDRRLEAARFDADGQTLVWLEGRSGHGMLLCQRPGGDAPRELAPDLSVRGEVGYGGGDFCVAGGFAYFVVQRTGRLWRVRLSGGQARPVTPPFGKAAAPVVSPDGAWAVYVHHDDQGSDRLAVVDAEGRHWPQILVAGHDFFLQPRFSPDGRSLAWIAWDHPNMPWDGTTLYLAPLHYDEDRPPRIGAPRAVAGGEQTSIFQPEFTPDGRRLLYVSDETGWGRIAVHELATDSRRWLTAEGEEYGSPAWVQDVRTYAVAADGRHAIAVRNDQAFARIERIDLESGERTAVEALSGYTDAQQIVAAPRGERIVFVGSSPTRPPRVIEHDFATGKTRVVARSSAETVLPEALASCEAISWKTGVNETAHGLFYAPSNERFAGVGKPPLVTIVHGGPTSQMRAGFSPQAQFFATRGYAVLFVNHRGSTGYGRDYMLRLRGNWGVCDVEDSVSGVQYLAAEGRVDADRAVILGGSAGGFTVLETMIEQPEAFAAGICLYGVANQFHLAWDTHKFEARYLDSLLGPLPECAHVYRERSPVFHADRIRRPIAIFQGENDQVVPKAQSDAIVEALKRNNTPHVYHVYEGEGHGWRKRETIEHFYRTVEDFLRQYVLFS